MPILFFISPLSVWNCFQTNYFFQTFINSFLVIKTTVYRGHAFLYSIRQGYKLKVTSGSQSNSSTKELRHSKIICSIKCKWVTEWASECVCLQKIAKDFAVILTLTIWLSKAFFHRCSEMLPKCAKRKSLRECELDWKLIKHWLHRLSQMTRRKQQPSSISIFTLFLWYICPVRNIYKRSYNGLWGQE